MTFVSSLKFQVTENLPTKSKRTVVAGFETVQVLEGATKVSKWLAHNILILRQALPAYAGLSLYLSNQMKELFMLGNVLEIWDLSRRVCDAIKGKVEDGWRGATGVVSMIAFRALGLVKHLSELHLFDLRPIVAQIGKVPYVGKVLIQAPFLPIVGSIALICDLLVQEQIMKKDKENGLHAKVTICETIHRMWKTQRDLFVTKNQLPEDVAAQYEEDMKYILAASQPIKDNNLITPEQKAFKELENQFVDGTEKSKLKPVQARASVDVTHTEILEKRVFMDIKFLTENVESYSTHMQSLYKKFAGEAPLKIASKPTETPKKEDPKAAVPATPGKESVSQEQIQRDIPVVVKAMERRWEILTNNARTLRDAPYMARRADLCELISVLMIGILLPLYGITITTTSLLGLAVGFFVTNTAVYRVMVTKYMQPEPVVTEIEKRTMLAV